MNAYIHCNVRTYPDTEIPAIVTVSLKIGPEALDPSPYEILKVPLWDFLVDDLLLSYLLCPLQAAEAQSADGTQRSEEPLPE